VRLTLAVNGREAIRIQRETPADILITDLVMPESDGFEVIVAFQQRFPAARLVVISGDQRLDTPRYLLSAKLIGAHATFRKPFEIERLLKTLKDLCAAPLEGPRLS
jgi:YesN/AraC family two-component response regulator